MRERNEDGEGGRGGIFLFLTWNWNRTGRKEARLASKMEQPLQSSCERSRSSDQSFPGGTRGKNTRRPANVLLLRGADDYGMRENEELWVESYLCGSTKVPRRPIIPSQVCR